MPCTTPYGKPPSETMGFAPVVPDWSHKLTDELRRRFHQSVASHLQQQMPRLSMELPYTNEMETALRRAFFQHPDDAQLRRNVMDAARHHGLALAARLQRRERLAEIASRSPAQALAPRPVTRDAERGELAMPAQSGSVHFDRFRQAQLHFRA